jgi:hypothetical protein
MPKIYIICSVCNIPCDERITYDIKYITRNNEIIYMLTNLCLQCMLKVKHDFNLF